MTRIITIVAAILAAFFFSCLVASAHVVDPPTAYDRNAEITLAGIVVEVDSEAAPDGAVGVHLLLKTEREIVTVHVAPARFIGENNFWFQTDDHIEITGARVFRTGRSALWARMIVKDGKTLRVRDENGRPLWKTADSDDVDGCGVPHTAAGVLSRRPDGSYARPRD
jgi:hypothetical protein